ncbi:MAG: PD40 domain-containing protein [Calditrichia bacterium]|nr:PD40 domain-containing protein [Calditrichia bacterium]
MKKLINISLFKTGFLLVVLLSLTYSQEKSFRFPVLSGDYLGQKLPGDKPELFAPGIISTGIYERDFTMTADGKEVYYGIFMGEIVTIMMTKQVDGKWTEPEVVSFADNFNYKYFEPAITLDGKQIFFCCTAPQEGEKPLPGYGHQNIWAADRQADGSWGEAYYLEGEINTNDNEYFPSVTKDGTMYFTRSAKGTRNTEIYRSKFIDGKYTKAERIPDEVNRDGNIYNAFIDKDEKYLIACLGRREDSVTPGRPNYYIFFRNSDDSWSKAVNLGERINFPGFGAIAESVSPDGKYFFFASEKSDSKFEEKISYQWLNDKHISPQNGNSDIYWVDMKVIEELRPDK